MQFLIPIGLVALIMLPLFFSYRGLITGKKTSNSKKAVIFNLSAFAVICLVAVVMPIGGFVSAASTTTTAAAGISVGTGLGYLAVALSTGLASLGAGIAVASGASAAIGAVSEDPKMLAKAILFVGLGEGIALYGMLFSFLIYAKL
jgi:V/A-type H+-transporting ATPase subunit K